MSLTRNTILSHSYRDSVVLMQLSRDLTEQPGVLKAAVMMGTPANLEALKDSGLLALPEAGISTDDLILAVTCGAQAQVEAALHWAVEALSTPSHAGKGTRGARGGGPAEPTSIQWRSLDDQIRLALISVPGPYAAPEAWKALRAGRNVFIFSDHVSIEDEVALKRAARERNLLVMGPECGTSIIHQTPLGFANRVRSGSIGVVAASGSGLQEITCQIDRLGGGITHAIGTGGRDLSPAVGGITMLQGIDLLLADPATRVLVLLSKPPDPQVAQTILERVGSVKMPVIACFLGASKDSMAFGSVIPTRTLEEAALRAVRAAGLNPLPSYQPAQPMCNSGQGSLIRGLFTGGTLAYEAMVVLQDLVGPVWSNKPINPVYHWTGGRLPNAHVCLDLGSDEFTAGRPHPMIDPSYRAQFLLQEAADPHVGVFLLDFILGYGSHPDPVGATLPAIQAARQLAEKEGRPICFIASVTGTHGDQQSYESQAAKLKERQVAVAPSNAGAARLAAQCVQSLASVS